MKRSRDRLEHVPPRTREDSPGSRALPEGMEFTVRRASWPRDGAAIRAIRTEVFVDEQHVPEAIERDGRDPGCRHVLAQSRDGAIIGTGRLLPHGQIGRLAVLRAWRNRGVGGALLEALVEIAREDASPEVFLNAQSGAAGFYLRRGFRPSGEEFMEAGIAHRRMVLAGR